MMWYLLAGQAEAPDLQFKSLCLVHEPFLCRYFPLTETMYFDTVLKLREDYFQSTA